VNIDMTNIDFATYLSGVVLGWIAAWGFWGFAKDAAKLSVDAQQQQTYTFATKGQAIMGLMAGVAIFYAFYDLPFILTDRPQSGGAALGFGIHLMYNLVSSAISQRNTQETVNAD
jgi:hypothetical protein